MNRYRIQWTIVSLSQNDDAVDADAHDDDEDNDGCDEEKEDDDDEADEDDEDGNDEEVLCKAKLFTRLFHLDSGSYWAATAVQALKGNIPRGKLSSSDDNFDHKDDDNFDHD